MTYRIAIGTLDGKTVTEHFGQCKQALILDISQETGETLEVETRLLNPSPGCGAGHDDNRIAAKAEALSDCHVILMARVGGQSEKQLIHRGFIVLSHEGPLEAALTRIKKAYKSRVFYLGAWGAVSPTTTNHKKRSELDMTEAIIPSAAKPSVKITADRTETAAARFDLRMLMPLAALLVSLILELTLPNHPKLRNPDYRQFQVLLIGLFVLFGTLIATAVFEPNIRKAASHPAALSVASLILLGYVFGYMGRFAQSNYRGFEILIAVIAFALAAVSAARWFVKSFRARFASPGAVTGALFLTLLIIILNHDALAEVSATVRSIETAMIVIIVLGLAVGLTLILVKSLRISLTRRGWFIAALVLLLGLLNVVTAKLLLLPQIYFPSLSRVIHVYEEEFAFLFLQCLISSFVLLIQGVLTGVVVGVVTGVLVGWSQRWNYWLNPFVRILGPIPTSTWIPLALVAFSTPRSAAVFVIAFGVWFQISILTASGIMNVKNTYYEVSSTLGATSMQNLFRIAIPDALPSIFLGLFNATCSSFAALVVAEMLGVKNGIGWYINWQKEMLSYPGVYAGLIIIAGFCYLFITIQFKLRDRLLSWQKGVIKW